MNMKDVLRQIPVYPETIKLPSNLRMNIDSKYAICEDDKRNLSWISEEAKMSALENRVTQSKPKKKPRQKGDSLYTAFGKTQTLHQWADEYGIKYHTLISRIRSYGMSLETALTFKYKRRMK